MRKQMVEVGTRREAVKLMPWAAVIAKVAGGYMGFERMGDYRTWRNQR